MRALQVLKNSLFLVLLFGMDQLVSIPQLVAAYTQNHHLFLFFLIIVYIAIAIAVIIFFWQFYRYKIKKNHSIYGDLPPRRVRTQTMLLMVLVWMIFMLFQIWYTNQFKVNISANQLAIEKLFEKLPIWTFTDGVLVAPVMEELIFRGIFFELFFQTDQPVIKVIGVIVNAVIFGALHDTGINFPIYAIMGAILAVTYMRTRDIKCSIGIHILNNFISFI
ncbi:CPBP family intramembrane metalloprotease [Pediococcus pentosaceus]|uniref:CPBP family intramembrane glutamic endopeptidase n=1 Tax=Pediococcus pentosaceus TaxID=1255 RepID=UPI001330659E|nr:type II CAAX endopeptidase family protein [Pediococcus pentosaceus]KAF0507243.1 CPBP family intramembrane metalloprotease [Pediococcus pentosaceus]MBF7138887.1 CPBP family intramembrane metalloprotease [Pediococcus pentosaceus]